MLFPHFYYKFYAKLKHLFKQCHNSLLGIPSPSKQKEHKYDWKLLRNSNKCWQKLPFQNIFKWNIFPALVLNHNLSYCYFLDFSQYLNCMENQKLLQRKHSNVTYIGTVKCCFLALCTGEHAFIPVFSSLIVITAKNYQAYFVVWLVNFDKVLVFQCSCLKKFHIISIILFRIPYLAAQ